MNRERKYILEQLIYAVVWLIVFLVPIVMAYLPASGVGQTVSWSVVLKMWSEILPFFFLFCLNSFWLAPYFLLRKKYIHYATFLLLAFAVFVWVDSTYITGRMARFDEWTVIEGKPAFDPDGRERSFKRVPDFQIEEKEEATSEIYDRRFFPKGEGPRGHRLILFPSMPIFPLVSRSLIAILMVGFSIAIKLLFKSLRDEEAMRELERRQLQSELEYLKYQINPHFFMNTLNNIHALVDIDATEAQKALMELSKMMRYVLYEADHKTILLSREIQFLNNYLELMKRRYTHKVMVKTSFPQEVPDMEIPPLLYISFIENAFKHGVSYQSDSLVYVALQIEEGNLIFTCSNTNKGKNEEQHSGIGLDNIRKRLNILYDTNYTLSINENTESFDVLLIIPLL